MGIKAGGVTRRDFLKTSAALAVVDFHHGWFGSRVKVASGENWLTVFYGEEPKFHVDARSFQGTPEIWKRRSGETLQFGIHGARHPGSSVVVDLTCELFQSVKGLNARINFSGLGLIFEGLASDWLGVGGLCASLIHPVRFAHSGAFRTTFLPGKVDLAADGRLRFRGGADVCSLSHDLQLRAWTVDLHPTRQVQDADHLLRCSTLTLSRGPENWNLQMPRGQWTIEDESTLFDSVNVDLEEHSQGNILHKAVFRRSALRPPAKIRLTHTNQLLPMALTDVRYSLNSVNRVCALSANLREPLVVRGDTVAVRLENPANQPALLAIRAGDEPPLCKIIADATLELPAFEDVFLDAPDHWKVRLDEAKIGDDSDDVPPLGNADARLRVANGAFSLEGALHLRVVRPLDGIDLGLAITNVNIALDGMLIQLADKNRLSLLVVDLPSQTLLEPAIPNSNPSGGDDVAAPNTPQYSRISAPTRLTFEFLTPTRTQCILSIASLLRWGDYRLHVAPQLIDPSQVPLGTPIPELATQIIVPAGLNLSPDQNHAFFASEVARHDDQVFQLWTARLSLRANLDEFSDGGSAFPVVDQLRPSLFALGTRPLLDPADPQYEFGYNKHDYEIIAGHLKAKAAPAKHLVVSNRGAWIDVKESWPVDQENSSSFHTRIAGGLEQLEEITFEGVLVPTGHRVTIVQSSQRQWCRDSATAPLVARFVKRYKIVYHERTIDYTQLRGKFILPGTQQLPFDSVTLLGAETPFLDFNQAKKFSDLTGGPSLTYWAWIDLPGGSSSTPFDFPIECVDRCGVSHRTTAQLLVAAASFIYDDHAGYPTYAQDVTGAYSNPPAGVDTTIDFRGSRIGYAQEIRRGDTSQPTHTFKWKPLLVPSLADAKRLSSAPWYPVMVSASLALEHSAAFSQPSPPPVVFEYSRVYTKEPFDYMTGKPQKNKAEIILGLSPASNSNPSPLNFNGQLGGGLALPSTGVQWLSRKGGAIFQRADRTANDAEATLDEVANGLFRIADVFEATGALASLLGAVSLASLLQDVSDATAQAAAVPKLAAEQLHTIESEVIDEVRGYLAGLLTYEQNIVTQTNQVLGQLQGLRNEVSGAIGLAASLSRVLLRESSPEDVAALKGNILFTRPSGGPVVDLGANLATKITESVSQRVQEATTLPLDAPQPVLPTIFQFRDYFANQLISAAASQAAPLLQEIEDAIGNAQAYASNALEKATSNATRVTDDFKSFFLFQFSDALNGLTDLVNGSIDVDTLLEIADTVQTVLQLIQQLPQWRSQWTDFRTQLLKQVTDAPGLIADALLNADQRDQAPFPAVIDILNCTGAGCVVNPLPAPVVNAAVHALSTQISPLFTNQSIQTGISDAVGKLNAFFDSFEQSLGTAIDQMINSAGFTEIVTDLGLIQDLLQVPRQISVSYDYDVALQSSGAFLAEQGGKQARLSLHSTVTLNLNGQPPAYDIEVTVSNFQLMLLPSAPFIQIGLDHVSFVSKNGQKPIVSCPISEGDIKFVGPLDFVANLAEALGLGDALIAQILGTGVLIGANIPLPSIEAGAFAMTGLAVSVAVHLDFLGKPLRLLFGFATPGQHFIVTYLFLGGGGFIDLEFTPSDLSSMSITGAIEMGAMLALNFGVAEGDVHAFAGFYMQKGPGIFELSGYYRCGGELSVLGLISASVEFMMSLTYEDRNGEAWLSGECDLVIDVHVFLFSTSVSLRMHHDFSGRSGN